MFDVGETLVDETNSWRAFAAHFGIEHTRVAAALERAVAERIDHRIALADAVGRPLVPGEFSYVPTLADCYPDAIPTLEALVAAGHAVGVVGNQPRSVEPFLTGLGVPLAVVGSSERWGVAKPHPAFFSRICDELRLDAEHVAYVGDRVDNDILPAAEFGMATVLVVRGPWGRSHANWPEASAADLAVGALSEIVGALAAT